MKSIGKILAGVVGVVGVVFVGLQLVPYGRDHTNPPVTAEPQWDSPRTRALAERACFDCHSNETKWPVYASVAPFSWIVQEHVDEGREVLNFSTIDRGYEEAGEAAEVVEEGEMPLWDYALMHPAANLSAGEKDELARGLRATFGSEGGEGALAEGERERHRRGGRGGDDEAEEGER